MANTATFDPRTAGWDFRLVPARLLRKGDVIEHCLRSLAVTDVTPMSGQRVGVTFHDGTNLVYEAPTRAGMVSRWRAPKCGHCGQPSQVLLTEYGITFRLCVGHMAVHVAEDEECEMLMDPGASDEYQALLPPFPVYG